MIQIKKFIIAILIPVSVGIVIGIITMPFMDYSTLKRPFLAPPGFLFPIVWTTLYTLMGISYGILKNKDLTNKEIDLIYYLQLGINALWSIIFFVFKWRLFAFFWILLLIVCVFVMIIKFYSKNKLAGLLQIPYLLWIIFAAYLNLAFYLLN